MLLTPGFRPSSPDIRDRVANVGFTDLPESFDLKPDADFVENQGKFNSCTANAGCSALEIMYKRAGEIKDFSRMFLYYHTRMFGNILGDTGAQPRDIGKALKNNGVCLESTHPYNEENLSSRPGSLAHAEAEQYKILAYESITPLGGDILTQIKTAVVKGIPVLLTIPVHGGLIPLGTNWKEHTWDWNSSDSNPIQGYHEVLIIGYDNISGRLLVENSWGSDWADGGFFGIPYDMVKSASFGELWLLYPNITSAPKPQVKKENKASKFEMAIPFIVALVVLYFMLR